VDSNCRISEHRFDASGGHDDLTSSLYINLFVFATGAPDNSDSPGNKFDLDASVKEKDYED